MEKCHVFPSISEEEFAEQVSEDSVIYFSKVNPTQYRQSFQGKLVSEKYTFILPKIIDINSEFVKNIVKIPRIDLFPDGNMEEIGEQLKVLQTLKSAHRVELSTLNKWIQNRKTEHQNRQLGYCFVFTAIIATVVVVRILIYLFVRYRRGQNTNTPK